MNAVATESMVFHESGAPATLPSGPVSSSCAPIRAACEVDAPFVKGTYATALSQLLDCFSFPVQRS